METKKIGDTPESKVNTCKECEFKATTVQRGGDVIKKVFIRDCFPRHIIFNDLNKVPDWCPLGYGKPIPQPSQEPKTLRDELMIFSIFWNKTSSHYPIRVAIVEKDIDKYLKSKEVK